MNLKQWIILPIICLCFGTATRAEDCGIAQFKKNADALNQAKIESVESLKNLFNQSITSKPKQCVSPLFSEFRTYYYRFMNAYEKSMEDYLGNYPLPAQEESKLMTALGKAGWRLEESEGMYYIGEDGEWFLRQFGKVLPADWNRYLQQRKKEVKEKFSEDAGLLISWEDMRSRIGFWEDFQSKYPTFSEKDAVDYYLRLYIRTYLTGMDNTRLADFETGKVQDEIISSYKKFLTLNKQSKYYKLVEGQFTILKQNGFELNEKTSSALEAFHKKKGIKTMLGVQPPTY